jgi:hypothetical protein
MNLLIKYSKSLPPSPKGTFGWEAFSLFQREGLAYTLIKGVVAIDFSVMMLILFSRLLVP